MGTPLHRASLPHVDLPVFCIVAGKKTPLIALIVRERPGQRSRPTASQNRELTRVELAAATGLLAGREHCQVECAVSLATWMAHRPSVGGRLREHGNRCSIRYAGR